MLVKKAIITAAARSQRALPLQTLIDGDGNKKSLLCILIEQSLAAGAEEIAVIVCPGDESSYARAAGLHAPSVRFIPQAEPRGYGHAILCARSFTNSDPFLHMVGDHLYVSTAPQPSARRLVELAQKERCSVSGVQSTRESLLLAIRNSWRPPRSAAQRSVSRGHGDREAHANRGRNNASWSPAFAPATIFAFSASMSSRRR